MTNEKYDELFSTQYIFLKDADGFVHRVVKHKSGTIIFETNLKIKNYPIVFGNWGEERAE